MAENEKKPLSAGALLKRRKKMHTAARILVRILFFITMPGAFTAGFSGVKYIFTQIGQGKVLAMNSFIWALIGLCAFTIIFGRFFCGYVCAFGSLGDFVSWISGLVQTKLLKRKKKYELPERVKKIAQKLKFFNLTFIVLFCALKLSDKLSGNSPWDVFSRWSSLMNVPAGYTIGIVSLIVIVIGMAVQERFFCQFLCPMGAVFALLPVIPALNLKRNESNCPKACKICISNCPVSLKLTEDDNRLGECISCGKCMAGCPRSNITTPGAIAFKNQIVPVIVKAVMFFVMGCFLGFLRSF